MNILEIIAKKRDRKELTRDEIEFFIKEYTEEKIADYQASALLMAIYINGMNDKEIASLTMAMAHSGEILDLSSLGIVVDKHSTGGIGDKITLILMPIIASLGIPVAKMSGRGLGFTGGTVDKLESIPGYHTVVSIEEFIKNTKEIGISLIGQTHNLAPADKKMYELRDTIGCIESIPLIASSIMSKKIAAGANKIVLDVTCGNGAFMKTKEEALKLAKTMKKIGKLVDKETTCILTNMKEPLGYAVGNILEVIEAVEFLKGKMPKDVKEVVLTLGAYIIKLAGKGESLEENKVKMIEQVENGKAYLKFLELVKRQGGDISYIEDLEKFEKAEFILKASSNKEGFVKEISAIEVGKLSGFLGAGRMKKEDTIDPSVGIVLCKKVGDEVKIGDALAYIYANDKEKARKAKKHLEDIIKIGDTKVEREKMILDVI